jgi:hypothetical protein
VRETVSGSPAYPELHMIIDGEKVPVSHRRTHTARWRSRTRQISTALSMPRSEGSGSGGTLPPSSVRPCSWEQRS